MHHAFHRFGVVADRLGEGVPQRQLSVGDLEFGLEKGEPPPGIAGLGIAASGAGEVLGWCSGSAGCCASAGLASNPRSKINEAQFLRGTIAALRKDTARWISHAGWRSLI
jgi:hypothetical protein